MRTSINSCLTLFAICLLPLFSQAQNTFPATGNVSIGAASPQFSLHISTNTTLGLGVQSTAAFSGSSGAFLRLYNSGTPTDVNQRIGGILLGTSPTATSFRTGAQIEALSESAWIDNSSQPTCLRFLTVPSGTTAITERMRITSSGNVGIGTTTPGTYKLAVEGTLGARRVKVTQTAWADFVFQPDYQLPSLQEVERFIKINKHLPDMPSEKEVVENGLDVGEMNRKLLQKVEELMLYMIEQQKENQEVKDQNLEIKSLYNNLLNRVKKLEN